MCSGAESHWGPWEDGVEHVTLSYTNECLPLKKNQFSSFHFILSYMSLSCLPETRQENRHRIKIFKHKVDTVCYFWGLLRGCQKVCVCIYKGGCNARSAPYKKTKLKTFLHLSEPNPGHPTCWSLPQPSTPGSFIQLDLSSFNFFFRSTCDFLIHNIRVLVLSIWTLGTDRSLLVGACPVHCRTLSSISL